MSFGIWQLWVCLAVAGAVQLYLLLRMLREVGFDRFRRSPRPEAAPEAPKTQDPAPAAGPTRQRAFGKRLASHC